MNARGEPLDPTLAEPIKESVKYCCQIAIQDTSNLLDLVNG